MYGIRNLIHEIVVQAIATIVEFSLATILVLLGALTGLLLFVTLYPADSAGVNYEIGTGFWTQAVGFGFLIGGLHLQKTWLGVYAYAITGFAVNAAVLVATAFLMNVSTESAWAFWFVTMSSAIITLALADRLGYRHKQV